MVAVGMRLDCVDKFVGLAPFLEPSERRTGMGFGMLLEVNVVKQAGVEPQQRVFAKVLRIALHGGRDHLRMESLIAVVDVLMEEGSGGFFAWERHGDSGLWTGSGQTRSAQAASAGKAHFCPP